MWRLFMIFFLLVYTGINIYTGSRLFSLVKYLLPSFKVFVFWPLYIFLCYSFVAIYLLRLAKIHTIRQAAMYSLPVIIYFFLALLIFDGVKIILHFMHHLSNAPGFSAAGTGIALGLAILLIIYGSFHAQNIRTTHYSITLNKNGPENPLRIALVSDFHIGVTVDRKWVAKIVNTVNSTEPDIICLAGDIFDGGLDTMSDLESAVMELKRLKAPLGVYACPGNHDIDGFSPRTGAGGTGMDRVMSFLEKAGVILLLDETALVSDRFYIIGRRDARPIRLQQQERKTAAELAAGPDRSLPLIFLDHQPVDFPAEEEAGADLILSGHTHRGQFFPGNIITARIFKKAGAAHYGHWQGSSAQGIVTSGAGVWGPPVRIGTDSEVAVLDITFGH